MAVGGTVVMANTVAQGLLTPMERATIQDHARYLMSRHDHAVDQLELTTGKVIRIKGTRIVVGTDVAGMVLEITLVSEAARSTRRCWTGSKDADSGCTSGKTTPASR